MTTLPKLSIGQINSSKQFLNAPCEGGSALSLSNVTGDLQSQVSASLYDLPTTISNYNKRFQEKNGGAPGVKGYNFYEESQIAKIYGITEDYTPPKRTKTAYMIYADHKREELLEENQNISLDELTREIARCWAKLDND